MSSAAIRQWGEREGYRRAQLLLNDTAYRNDELGFERECMLVGAAERKKGYTVFCPPVLKLTEEIVAEARLAIPAMHGALYGIQRLVEAELKDVLEAEARWRAYDMSDMPSAPPSAPSRFDGVALAPNGEPFITLSALVEQYSAATRKPKKTVSKLRLVCRYIDSLTGHETRLNEVTKRILIKLQTDALRLPARPTQRERQMTFVDVVASMRADDERPKLTPQAVRSWFNLLGGCFNWAANADLIEKNPTTGVKPKVKKSDERRRQPFSSEDLAALFDPKVYPAPDRLNPAKFWLPLLGLFTGARLNEIGQLLRTDIAMLPTPHIVITDLAEDSEIRKRLKNVSSRRVVPIHHRLIELGFVDFIEGCKSKHLFKDLPHPENDNDYESTKAYSQWFGRYLMRINVKTRDKTFHSFRHTFITEARNSGMNPNIISEIVGHDTDPNLLSGMGAATTGQYGNGYRLEVLAREMEKLTFPVHVAWHL